MNSQVKQTDVKFSRKELVSLCNEKLICAARDLAEFTKHGIYAHEIVDLAHKCERFDQMLQAPLPMYQQKELRQLERDLLHSLQRICQIGQKIFRNDRAKYKEYVISKPKEKVDDSFAQPGMHVA